MEAYEFDTNVFLHQNPNLKVSTDHLYPPYARKGNKNKHNQGLGKGHLQALKFFLEN